MPRGMTRGPNGIIATAKPRVLRLPAELDEAVQWAAAKRGLTVTVWIREVLQRAVERDKRNEKEG